MKLNVEQRQALKVLESGKNVFLTRGAGTGKSYLLKEFIKRIKHKNIVIVHLLVLLQ